jgi:hypothetical protein
MKRRTAGFLQAVVVLVGLLALVFLLAEPHFEGRNVNATVFEIYFKDAVLAYAYVASIPFFVGLSQIFKALGFVGQDQAASQETVKALRTIRFCALALIGFVVVSFFFQISADPDDSPAGVFMRLLVALPSAVVALAAAKLERLAQTPSKRAA